MRAREFQHEHAKSDVSWLCLALRYTLFECHLRLLCQNSVISFKLNSINSGFEYVINKL